MNALPSDLVPVLNHTKDGSGITTDSVVHQAALQAIERFRQFVKDYDELNKRETGIKRGNKMRWEQDIQDLRMLNDETMKLSAEIVTSFVMPNPGPALGRPANDGIKRVAWDMLEQARPGRPDATWGAMAHDLVRKLTGLMKFLT